MLPQRQASAKRALSSHRKPRATLRNAAFVGVGLIFALYMYFNLRFFATSTVSTNSMEAAGKGWRSFNGAPNPVEGDGEVLVGASATRQVKHLVFTSTCREIDFVHTEVLAFTLRRTGFEGNVTHLLYGCTTEESTELIRKKDPRHNVQTRLYADVSAVNTTFGEKLLTTTLNPVVLAKWMLGTDGGEFSDDRSIPFKERYALESDDFVMAVDSDAIFTKKLDMWNLMAEANDAIDPRMFGQDASWYWPNRFPLTHDELTSILPTNSRALLLDDWREYAAIAPFVSEVSAWQLILPTAVDLWDKLSHEKRYLAVPVAAAHEKTIIGVSGVLSVHHYPSRYQNWDFVDDIKHNPCVGLAEGPNLALSSYPISIRALNFTLPQWIDGREWSFFADKVPSGFLTCDAWMMRQPNGYLWHLATHTNGYERVPNILRRRHTMSVCLAAEAYNSAADSYRSQMCPTGYNHNRRIPMEFQQETWSTAVAMAENTPMEEDPPVYFGNFKKKKSASTANESDLKPGQEGSDEVHFVFSTSCEPHQNWQSEALAQSFARVGQSGSLTRIVSGCSDEDVKSLLRRTQKSAPHLRIHVTRDFRSLPVFKEVSSIVEKASMPDDYAPYNKPFGLRDWLESANPPVREELIVVLEPDFLFIRPFAVNTGGRVTTATGVNSGDYEHDTEIIEGMRQYKRFFVYAGSRDAKTVSDTVGNGVAVAQRWPKQLGTAAFDDSSAICPECAKVSKADAAEYYAVGSPYAITRKDLTGIVGDYCNMTVLMREQMNRKNGMSEMSEMMGYSLAAAKHGVKHTMFDNLALANNDNDYSGFISLMKANPCEDPVEPIIPGEAPALLHGYHVYEADDDRGLKWMYSKNSMPNDLFTCDSWLLAAPPSSVWTLAKRSRDKQRMLEAYGVCTSIKVFNQALVDFKERMFLAAAVIKCPHYVLIERTDAVKLSDTGMSWAYEPVAHESLHVLLDVSAQDAELLGSELDVISATSFPSSVQAAKCSVETMSTSVASPTRPPATLNDEQRRSRHNANERRRTNALKTRILLMREEMEALERQRARLQRDSQAQNRVFLDTVSLIDQLRQEQQELRLKLRAYDMQNSTYQTIVSEYGAPLSSSSGAVEASYDKEEEDAEGEGNMASAPIFQRVLFRRPMQLEAVMACVKESYESIMAFRAERDFETLNTEVLGWCDKRILNARSLRFMLSQQFEYVPPTELVYKTWNLLTNLKLYRNMQPRTVALELLQRVTEDCVIVRLSVSNGDKVHHSILLIARGRIDGGFLITYRSIPLSEGQRQFAATESNYVNLFNWYVFLEKTTPSGIPACEVTFGGCVENQSMEYLRYLMMEVVAGVVRWQTAVGHNKFRLTHK
ncbi:hypothetical protein BBP00_00001085 [Phytophthora kernoviae]|uniref:Hydroxyproline O-arabinosyltransferase-like domain-containing protein n=1 Tax=Phytophthora kernoviae TaxID=325452 RepID=A0A3F2S2J5_9STRA|nr:hypothetical protein BBP00_00001085 [Phytophthora kernoviae]